MAPTRLAPSSTSSLITATTKSQPSSDLLSDDIVVVGAGIAGLATALSLHRLGILSLVLEQGESLRTGGTSLTLFKNGWRVLDAVGIGDELRSKFLQIQCCVQFGDEIRRWEGAQIVLV